MRLVDVVGYEADEARISTFYKVERFNGEVKTKREVKTKWALSH